MTLLACVKSGALFAGPTFIGTAAFMPNGIYFPKDPTNRKIVKNQIVIFVHDFIVDKLVVAKIGITGTITNADDIWVTVTLDDKSTVKIESPKSSFFIKITS